MGMTAAVLNAGLGDISFGLQMAGFSIIAAYETDLKAAAVHEANIEAPVFHHLPQKSDLEMISSADLLAVRLTHFPLFTSNGKRFLHDESRVITEDSLLQLLEFCQPKALLVVLSAAAAKSKVLDNLLYSISQKNFRCGWAAIDTARTVGIPVAERKVFLMGIRGDLHWNVEFPEQLFTNTFLLEEFLQPEREILPWYFASVKTDRIPIMRSSDHRVYCWNLDHYEGASRIRWNSRRIPLVETTEALRKMTHREIAGLKGFPNSYTFPEPQNKSWLYQKLTSAVNVLVLEKLAKELRQGLTGGPQESAAYFESLLGKCLSGLIHKSGITNLESMRDPGFDYVFRFSNHILCIETKYYSSRQISPSKIRKICSQLPPAPEAGDRVLALTSQVSASVKRDCWENFHIALWDIGNLLWLFNEFEDIKNNFIALLDYSIRDIEPAPPEWNMLYAPPEAVPGETPAVSEPVPETSEEAVPEPAEQSETPDWRKRLDSIAPGRDHCREYESFCYDILKHTLGQYLTLWATQPQTNDGLHRFDLCCKIKIDEDHDFFNTIARYFNTKYIVFEFKNYTTPLTQKEIYTTEKYLYGTALRKVAILVSRSGYDVHALQAAKGSLRENGKLILCLTSENLLEMASIMTQGIDEPANVLSKILDDLLIHLEK